MDDLEIKGEIERLRAKVNSKKQKKQRSKLDHFGPDLLALRHGGATYLMIRIWLKEHNVSVVNSTLHRWFCSHA